MSKEQKSDTDQHQFWKMVMDTFESSGLSVRQFCQKEGLTEASFYSWRKRFSNKNKSADQSEPKEKSSDDDFIRVSLPDSNTCSLELVLTSGNILRISSHADNKTLTNVLSALCEAGLC